MPKLVDHEAYRSELLSGCFRLFAERGYASLTMRQIASELKVSTGTLYHYFDSKPALFRKMIESLAGRDVNEATQRIGGALDTQARVELLLTFIEDREPYFRSLLLLALDYERVEGFSGDDPLVRQIVRNYKTAIGELLGNPTAAEHVFTLFAGFIVTRILDPESGPAQASKPLLHALLGLATP